MTVDLERDLVGGDENRSYRYYRNAVERHWDPQEIDLSEDRVRIARLDDVGFDQLKSALALFGAGEEAVTEDLAPLTVVSEDIHDQMFLTTQLYEEAKHADFFSRYWRTVITPEEHSRGNDVTSPRDDHWFNDAYVELFDRTEEAMHRLLVDDTPENRAKAYCHYHLTVEGILAQTGYYGVQGSFNGSMKGIPELPGLVEGFSKVRADEGRHVGFGMTKLKDFVESGQVEAELIRDEVSELVQLTQNIVGYSASDDGPGRSATDLVSYAAEKHVQRMQQITDASEEIPDVEQLVNIEDPKASGDD